MTDLREPGTWPTRADLRRQRRPVRHRGDSPRPGLRRGVAPAVVLVLALGAAAAGGRAWLGAEQRRHYAAGHRQYLHGECAAAIPDLDAARGRFLDDRLAGRATAEWQACRRLLGTSRAAARAEPAGAVLGYLDYLGAGGEAPLRAAALREMGAGLGRADLDDLVKDPLCRRVEELRTVLDGTEPVPERLPELLMGCAWVWERTKLPIPAQDLYELVRREYPEHATEAGTSLVRMAYEAARDGRPRRNWVPRSFASDPSLNGKVRIVAVNEMVAQPIVVMLAGERVVIRTLKPCTDCVARPAGRGCTLDGPSITLTLPPGRYRFVSGPEGGLKRFGELDLRPDEVYRYCLFTQS